MLVSLRIKNIAVIDELQVEFSEGFNVLTGETGAGKSIIIDSINMVLGQRTSKELIRSGKDKAIVEAMFWTDNPEVFEVLEQMGIECDDGSILIYRDMSADGRSAARINGSMVTASMLREVSRLLVNIHGQQDNQSLLVPANHVEYLDSYANIDNLKDKYKVIYDKVRDIEKRIKASQVDEQEKARRIDLLEFQVNEIENAKLKVGEEEELLKRKEFLEGSEKISTALEKSRHMLYSADVNVHDILADITSCFAEVSGYDEKLGRFYESLNGISIELDDLIYEIRDYADNVTFNPGELDQIAERIDLIHNLKRKYGPTIEDILKYLDDIKKELEGIIQSDEIICQLSKELEENKKSLSEAAAQITKERTRAAHSLEQKIMQELSDLDMNRVKFKVDIKPQDFSANGADNVEFLISTNPGEPLKPLSKIASGGEMSRIMLAIKSILADSDAVSTLILDEIDTGVSGRAAQKIAQKIHKISSKKQVLCITHLAQIAAMAKTHFLIEKHATDEATETKLKKLDYGQRVHELARIIGGAKITDLTEKNAEEMLALAEALKNGENRDSN